MVFLHKEFEAVCNRWTRFATSIYLLVAMLYLRAVLVAACAVAVSGFSAPATVVGRSVAAAAPARYSAATMMADEVEDKVRTLPSPRGVRAQSQGAGRASVHRRVARNVLVTLCTHR